MRIYVLLICCAKMNLREVERWLPKVFLVIYSFQWSSPEGFKVIP